MSAPIDANDNNNITSDSNELAKQSKGGIEHVSPGDTGSTGPRSRHDARRLPPTWEVWSSSGIYARGFSAMLLPRDRRPWLARAEPPDCFCNELCGLPEEATPGPDQSGRGRRAVHSGRRDPLSLLHMGVVRPQRGTPRLPPSHDPGHIRQGFLSGSLCLKDDVTRSPQKELQAKTERDAANEAINQVRTEEEEFKQRTISKRSAYPTSSGNRLFSLAGSPRPGVEKASDQTFRCHLGLERPSTEVRQTSTRITPGQQ